MNSVLLLAFLIPHSFLRTKSIVRAWPTASVNFSPAAADASSSLRSSRTLSFANRGIRSGDSDDVDNVVSDDKDTSSTSKLATSPYTISSSSTAQSKTRDTSVASGERTVHLGSAKASASPEHVITPTENKNFTQSNTKRSKNQTSADGATPATSPGNHSTPPPYDDDDAYDHSMSQWNITNATDTGSETNGVSLSPFLDGHQADANMSAGLVTLLNEHPQPESWPIVVGSTFVLLAVVLFGLAAGRAFRGQSTKRAGYEEIQSLVV